VEWKIGGASVPTSRSENDSHVQTAARADARPTRFELVQMKMSREGREGGKGFFMDKIFDESKINL